ncbi:MFS transporter [Amycolatopsis rubida]|uniref:MFS transporter n=1 Tax=Amycolatopsis rubida TaxID=112413 RepID=A0ABX0BYT1_9PSEU|nr:MULTISPECIES: MFS transporter [Amycolatopsis]MYW95245.1 MFS transporter [Amycolatopsis rubida]NEC60234.1 MFS transporter [Amycolatopsis rubida]OAP28356.1 Multidrug resistance protein stp [Amycolatopsis sp. M39]
MRKWGPLAAICLGSFMLILDTTVVTVALPEMARGLGASLVNLQWVVNSYTLVLAILALSAGAIGDIAGQRRVFGGSVTVFAAASLGCALAPNVGVLIGARTVQGIGGAAMMVAAMSLLGANYAGKERGAAFGIWTAVLGGAGAAGPFLGGVLTQWAGWQAIFFLNLPLSVLTLLLTRTYLAEAPKRPAGTRIDFGGMLAFGISSGALIYAVIQSAWPVFAVAAVALIVFVVVERRVKHPMLDLALFRRASFVTVLIVVVASSFVFACLIYASIWLQSAIHLSPAGAGLALIPLAATSFVASLLIGKRLHAVSPGIVLGLGALLATAGCGLEWILLDRDSTWLGLLPGLIVTGAGMGIAGPAGSTAILSAVPQDRAGMASGAMATFRQLGQTLGVAVLGLVYAATADLGDVFLVTAGLSLVAAVLSCLVLPRNNAGAPSRTRGSSAAADR